VSLKHNSKFASFTLIAKSDFPAELNIPIPFSLVSNDVANDRLTIMPAYWFMHNMYALARNAGKYISRDKREDKSQVIEYDYLGPDSVNEIFDALRLIKKFTATAHAKKVKKPQVREELIKMGESLLENNPSAVQGLDILAEGFENSNREVWILKPLESYKIFKELVIYYGVSQLIEHIDRNKIDSWAKLQKTFPDKEERSGWKNIGGQLMTEQALKTLMRQINSGKINSWDEVHEYYIAKSRAYPLDKFRHAFASLMEILKITPTRFTKKLFLELLEKASNTRGWMFKNISDSRTKDYTNAFRRMVYDNDQEMNKVLGKLEENSFINQQKEELKIFKDKIQSISARFA